MYKSSKELRQPTLQQHNVIGSLSRPIEFRAWDDKRFTYSNEYEVKRDTAGDTLSKFFDECFGCEFQQYVGLTDKEDNKIYEGDILLFKMMDGTERHFKVWFTIGGFAINQFEDDFYKSIDEIGFWSGLSDMHTASFVNGNCQRIGNVFENPELLKRVR